MKKYRCPNCKEILVGTPDKCPNCGVNLRYQQKEKPREVVEAKTINNFNFNDPDVVKHEDKFVPVTSVESFEDPEERKNAATPAPVNNKIRPEGDSFFDGRLIQRIGVYLLAFLLFIITIGIGFPWSYCKIIRWETKHTVIQGHRLKFDGKGSQLFGRYMLWLLLTILTLGIILLWVQIFLMQWKVKHIVFDTEKPNKDKKEK